MRGARLIRDGWAEAHMAHVQAQDTFREPEAPVRSAVQLLFLLALRPQHLPADGGAAIEG